MTTIIDIEKTNAYIVGVGLPASMIKAGAPVDEMRDKLAPLLSSDDVVIDGNNSFFADTQRREASMRARCPLRWHGRVRRRGGRALLPLLDARVAPPSAYDQLRPILEAIAAKTDSGPCVTYVGPDGAGHFVKMIHSDIEYGLMQLIGESYDLLRRVLGFSAAQTAVLFAERSRGPMESYLIEIASQVLSVRDPETGNPMVEMILDQAGQKGTGKCTAQVALDLGVPIPTLAAAIDARVLSSMKGERVRASERLVNAALPRAADDAHELEATVRDALLAATICAYAQGMALLLDTDIATRVLAGHGADGDGVRAPGARAVSASLAYFDSYRTALLPQNLTQVQRGYFGAHTYPRTDRPEAGFVHSDWQALIAAAATAAVQTLPTKTISQPPPAAHVNPDGSGSWHEQ